MIQDGSKRTGKLTGLALTTGLSCSKGMSTTVVDDGCVATVVTQRNPRDQLGESKHPVTAGHSHLETAAFAIQRQTQTIETAEIQADETRVIGN